MASSNELAAAIRDFFADHLPRLRGMSPHTLQSYRDRGIFYEAATNEARALGVFGAPTFVTRSEPFWGDDRLEDAVTWHQRGMLGAPRPP